MLSDHARAQVSTDAAAHRAAGELVEDAVRLLDDAEQLLRLAVAAERAASTPWQEIGERLGVSRQSAHERFAGPVREIADGVLFPARESDREGALGWWACAGRPRRSRGHRAQAGCVGAAPPRTHRSRPRACGRCPPASAVAPAWTRSGWSTALARRITNGDLPPGVPARQARRLLLEHKLEAFDAIAASESGQRALDARAQAGDVFTELVAWHRDDLEPRVSADSVPDAQLEAYRFALDRRPVAELAFTAFASDEDTGWFLWRIDAAVYTAASDTPRAWLGDPWPLDVADVDDDELVALARERGRDALQAEARRVAQRTRAGALAAARAQLLAHLASDLAKGVAPFAPGGLAGPPRSADQAA